jgi:outer membrane murein-binding lipoprotein Lpp
MRFGTMSRVAMSVAGAVLLVSVTSGCAKKPTEAQEAMATRVEAAASKTEAAANKAEAAAKSAAEAAQRAEAAANRAEQMFQKKLHK